MENKFSIINKTKGKLPFLQFEKIKNDVLGKDYILSIAYVSKQLSKSLNKKYRNKDNPTNILSFILHKDKGEIVLCPSVIRKEAVNFKKTFKQFNKFLIIHGMLHLKGLDHGEKMEKEERRYLSRNK